MLLSMLLGYIGCRFIPKRMAFPIVLIIGILIGLISSSSLIPLLYPFFVAASYSPGISIFRWYGMYLFTLDIELFPIVADLEGFSPMLILSCLALSLIGIIVGFELARRRVIEISDWSSE